MKLKLVFNQCSTFILFSFALKTSAEDGYSSNCSKKDSQFVRKFVKNYLKSELTTFGEKYYPDGCPFSIKFEVYQNYENRKVEESVSKWTCNFCGKSFVSEDFLDQHFERKHPGHLRNDLKCLANVCPYFRCNVSMENTERNFHFTENNCPKIELSRRRNECYDMINKCISPNLRETDAKFLWGEKFFRVKLNPKNFYNFSGRLNETICRFLTCKNYWKRHVDEFNPLVTALYVIGTIFYVIFLLVYYLIVYAHYSTYVEGLEAKSRGESYKLDDYRVEYSSYYPNNVENVYRRKRSF